MTPCAAATLASATEGLLTATEAADVLGWPVGAVLMALRDMQPEYDARWDAGEDLELAQPWANTKL